MLRLDMRLSLSPVRLVSDDYIGEYKVRGWYMAHDTYTLRSQTRTHKKAIHLPARVETTTRK
jgi:hypothetical protein